MIEGSAYAELFSYIKKYRDLLLKASLRTTESIHQNIDMFSGISAFFVDTET